MNMMKKYLFMLAAFIAVAATFTACSSEEDAVSSAEQERGMVKTEFTISFPQTTTGMTRLSADVVQVAAESNLTKFRGIKDIHLYPFSLTGDFSAEGTEKVPTAITLYGGTVGKSGSSGTENNSISGYNSSTYNAETGLASLYKASNAHLYKNVDIPIGVNKFIFYGEAATTSSQTAQQVGSLTSPFSSLTSTSTLSSIEFSPTPIFTGTTVGANGDAVAAYLTSIATTKDGDGNSWKDTENVGLATLYENFKEIKTGSWANVKAIAQRVYDNVAPQTSDNASTIAMKNAIRSSILNASYGVTQTDGILSFANDYGNYPADIFLPDGAAYVTWDDTNSQFSQIVTAENNTGMNVAPLSNYVYPASLYYWVRSGIKTSEEALDSYSNEETWTTITGKYTSGTRVTSNTRSIVIEDAVQYAVARLDLTVIAASGIKDGPLNDAKVATGKTINLLNGSTPLFPITGIIIGGQKPVNYQFEQKTSSSKIYTIYDNQVTDDKNNVCYLTTTKSNAVHTLVLETNDATSATDTGADVQIAIEFLNNGTQTIVGYNGQYILPKTKFYLIGTLHPWKAEETSPTIKRAFKQDYTTTANIVVNSFANAHNTLPDLSVPQLDLGLSIDLTWQTGITYDVTIQ